MRRKFSASGVQQGTPGGIYPAALRRHLHDHRQRPTLTRAEASPEASHPICNIAGPARVAVSSTCEGNVGTVSCSPPCWPTSYQAWPPGTDTHHTATPRRRHPCSFTRPPLRRDQRRHRGDHGARLPARAAQHARVAGFR
ncbi:unnamed protein product [Arctogadus glacialis]